MKKNGPSGAQPKAPYFVLFVQNSDILFMSKKILNKQMFGSFLLLKTIHLLGDYLIHHFDTSILYFLLSVKLWMTFIQCSFKYCSSLSIFPVKESRTNNT